MIHSNRAKKVISWLPKERVLLETDGPFAKVDGKIQYPSNVIEVMNYLATNWEVSNHSVSNQLRSNLRRLLTNS
ncbi:TatD family hydrolase [Shewanella sp. SM32]|nr:TatD family hydrolase [Shewanella sp. SM32]